MEEPGHEIAAAVYTERIDAQFLRGLGPLVCIFDCQPVFDEPAFYPDAWSEWVASPNWWVVP